MALTMPLSRWRTGFGELAFSFESLGHFRTIRRVGQDEVARMARRRHRRGWPA